MIWCFHSSSGLGLASPFKFPRDPLVFPVPLDFEHAESVELADLIDEALGPA